MQKIVRKCKFFVVKCKFFQKVFHRVFHRFS
nr:MAG TPA: hypothetical protein [Caudoviricetes sp.]